MIPGVGKRGISPTGTGSCGHRWSGLAGNGERKPSPRWLYQRSGVPGFQVHQGTPLWTL